MEEINIPKSIEINGSYYIDPSAILLSFMKKIGTKLTYEELVTYIKSFNINLTPEIITSELNKRFSNEEPDAKRLLDQKKSDELKPLDEWNEKEIEDNTSLVLALAIYDKYRFEPNCLVYFTKYVDIVKNKILELLSLSKSLEELKNGKLNNPSFLKEKLLTLNIEPSNDGLIKYSDYQQIINSLYEDYLLLKEKTSEGNLIKSYENLSVSDRNNLKKHIDDEEFFPSLELINDKITEDDEEEYIPQKSKS